MREARMQRDDGYGRVTDIMSPSGVARAAFLAISAGSDGRRSFHLRPMPLPI